MSAFSWDTCGECGVEPEEIVRGPEGQRVCPDCRDELQEWYDDNAPDPCPNCGYWSMSESTLCGSCLDEKGGGE